MANCKNCVHDSVCYLQEICNDIEEWLAGVDCADYKDRTKYVERKSGWWESHSQADDVFCCSVCKLNVSNFEKRWLSYCPHCGSDMRGGDGNEIHLHEQ